MRALIEIMSVSRRQLPWMLAGILLGIAVIAANALLMAVSGWFITTMAIAGATGIPAGYFLPSVMIRILAMSRTAGRYGERLVMHEAAFRQLADLRVWLFRHLAPLAPAGLERYAAGDIAGRLRADIDALENLYLRILAPLATGSITIVLAVAGISFWSNSAAAVLLITLLATTVLLPLLARQLAAEPGRQSTELSAELRNAVTEGIQGVEELTILGALDRQAGQVEGISARLTDCQQRLGNIGALTQSAVFSCSGLTAALLLACGAASVTARQLTGPEMVMILLFAGALFEAAMAIPAALQQVPATSLAAGRILEIVRSAPPVPEPATPAPARPQTAAILFKNVSCSYLDHTAVISNLCLDIADGTKIALVGPSGCGKSTLAEILLGFRPFHGLITIGGVDIRSMPGDELRQLISALPQQPHLFNSTIRDNIIMARPDATPEELQLAVTDAGLADWIEALPLGLDTPVGEFGSAVSGGEARRIALARALLKDAPILLLDEPTEGLDAKTEQFIIERLKERTAGKTVILITHRPACLELVDRVVSFP